MDKTQSYLTATPYRECYDGLIKCYDLNKSLFSSYVKVYSLKRSREDKDKNEDPPVGSDRGLKKKKTRKDAEPTKGSKTKESKSSSSKGTKTQSKYSRKSVQAEKPKFEVADSDMLQNQEGNLGNDDEEPMREVASKLTRVEVMQKHGYGYLREMKYEEPIMNFTYSRKETSLDFRRWSYLEKKRAHIMVKAIDKQLKERRMMRSLEKFFGGRHYGTDL
uniref:Uncharacterized protein n=1 Tax=Tanacetum cinerariifolium TaxID=118510 RepID=A0A6L2J9R5_TANCI|nr:hypothetical protein [Tanacetum cinerariifolium]